MQDIINGIVEEAAKLDKLLASKPEDFLKVDLIQCAWCKEAIADDDHSIVKGDKTMHEYHEETI